MGNSIGKVCLCSAGAGDISRRHNNNPLGDSILYVRPPDPFSDCDVTTTFRSVSGASVSANSSTPPSTSTTISDVVLDSSASFESSTSFTSSLSMVVPLQNHHHHHASRAAWWSSPMVDIGFSSGPVLNESGSSETVKKLRRSFSHDGYDDGFGNKPKKQNLKKILKRVVSGVVSIKKKGENANGIGNVTVSGGLSLHDGEDGIDDDENYLDDGGGDLVLMGSENLQWAQGRAGEDRVHIVISEEHGWVFVGIYDGFNGPDATDYLLDNLFYAVYDELKGLLCGHKSEESMDLEEDRVLLGFVKGNDDGSQMVNCYKENYPMENEKLKVEGERIQMKKNTGWENEGESEKVGLDNADAKGSSTFSHSDVLLALSVALRKTEDAFLKSVDEMINNNPVLAMMGSCVLVMLMKGEDVYLMNVGDSRAVLATHSANSLQLTMEHSTHIKEEVQRIRKEHPDDPSAITKGRVKGYLNVTRAFGAGFLKQPKQNNAVLETFKVNYIGESPYISCSPSLHHHRLSPSDRFLILSSDGLHQYFTNEEAVAKVESFITLSPDIDPAQLLIKEALCRAAKKAGMDIHELLEIPQGERRLYHDDISIVIISFEGKIWRSSV